MIENIVRLLSHPGEQADETVNQKIRRAAHEVQRPVFYSIAIIITAYLPIFTLQAVEGRLVQADGLDGGVRAAGRADLLDAGGTRHRGCRVSQGDQGVAQPADGLPDATCTTGLWARPSVGAGPRPALAVADSRRNRGAESAASDPSFYRIWTKAPSGCAARWRPAPARAEGIAIANRGSDSAVLLSGSSPMHQPSGPARRRNRHHRLLQHRILRRSEAQGTMAAGVSSEQGRAHRRP